MSEERKINIKGIFKGIIFVADFNKEFHGMTQVTSISQSSFLNEVIGGRIQMEDAKFNNKFDVYSTDEVEARYILSPNLMERLLALNKKFNTKIQIAFSKSDVIILIDSKHNNFEAKLFSAITDSHINKDYQVANDLLSIVDELNLNTRIWTKE